MKNRKRWTALLLSLLLALSLTACGAAQNSGTPDADAENAADAEGPAEAENTEDQEAADGKEGEHTIMALSAG